MNILTVNDYRSQFRLVDIQNQDNPRFYKTKFLTHTVLHIQHAVVYIIITQTVSHTYML